MNSFLILIQKNLLFHCRLVYWRIGKIKKRFLKSLKWESLIEKSLSFFFPDSKEVLLEPDRKEVGIQSIRHLHQRIKMNAMKQTEELYCSNSHALWPIRWPRSIPTVCRRMNSGYKKSYSSCQAHIIHKRMKRTCLCSGILTHAASVIYYHPSQKSSPYCLLPFQFNLPALYFLKGEKDFDKTNGVIGIPSGCLVENKRLVDIEG